MTDLLLTEPVVFFFSLWVAFSWAVLYLTFSAIPLGFTKYHGFNTKQNGAVFAGKALLCYYANIINGDSYVCRSSICYSPQHLPRESCKALRQALINPRRTTVLQLRGKRSPTYRPLLVRMDFLLLSALDRSYAGGRMRNNGHLLDLSCSL